MCPPALPLPPPGAIGLFWTDEQIILALDRYIHGSPVPDDVIVDNPYQYDPSNLPDGVWFLVRSAEEKQTKDGFWLAKGEACEVFANSDICGWRTTYEYFELEALIGQKTVWMIQEYKITQNGQHEQTKSKESALCRAFSYCVDDNLINALKPEHQNDDIVTSNLLSLFSTVSPHTSSSHEQHSIGEPEVKNQSEGSAVSRSDKVKDPSGDDVVAELDCILKGDYLELDDLVDVASHSSSSDNSSCQSVASDEYFDSLALLRDLDEEKNQDLPSKGSSSNYRIMMCQIENDVVMQHEPLESLVGGSEAAAGKHTQQLVTEKDKFPCKPSPDQAAKRLKAEYGNEGPSNSYRVTSSSSSSHEPVARREERRMKKVKKYLCFMPF